MDSRKKRTLQVGKATEETTPVAAVIEISGMFGTQKYFFQEEEADRIIDDVYEYQDLECLSRMAMEMGDEEDREIGLAIQDFLSDSGDKIEDYDCFDYSLSVGTVRCLGWAKGEENCALLKSLHKDCLTE